MRITITTYPCTLLALSPVAKSCLTMTRHLYITPRGAELEVFEIDLSPLVCRIHSFTEIRRPEVVEWA